MGMFDNLTSELPEHAKHPSGWQTKDTPAQCLYDYTIGADRKLYVVQWVAERREDREREFVDFTGSIEFYDFEKLDGTPGDHRTDKMRTWMAFFENGIMFKLIDKGFDE